MSSGQKVGTQEDALGYLSLLKRKVGAPLCLSLSM